MGVPRSLDQMYGGVQHQYASTRRHQALAPSRPPSGEEKACRCDEDCAAEVAHEVGVEWPTAAHAGNLANHQAGTNSMTSEFGKRAAPSTAASSLAAAIIENAPERITTDAASSTAASPKRYGENSLVRARCKPWTRGQSAHG